jgi:hypothetical protein
MSKRAHGISNLIHEPSSPVLFCRRGSEKEEEKEEEGKEEEVVEEEETGLVSLSTETVTHGDRATSCT